MSAKYSGLSFPKIFNSTKQSSVVTDIDKMRANIYLLLNQQIDMVLMNPQLGVDLESILFSDDIAVTRDFLYTFISDSVLRDMPDVELRDVVVDYQEPVLRAYLHFKYKKGSIDFDVDYSLKGAQV